MKTILVTGGAGFIGSHLCEKLLIENYNVISIDNFNKFYSPKIKRNNVQEIRKLIFEKEIENKFFLEEGDIRSKEFLNGILEKYPVDGIIHLAAYAGVRPSIDNPVLYGDVNIQGTINLLEASRMHHINKFIFASSSSVYGNNSSRDSSELDVVDYPISPYAATKKAGELVCHTYHHLYQFSIACLRFFTVYGPRQRPDLAIHKFTKLINEGLEIPLYGDGESQRDYTYIDDIIMGTYNALEWVFKNENKYEIFNLGESSTISLKDMVSEIENRLGKKAIIRNLPNQPGDVRKTFANVQKSEAILDYHPSTKFSDGIDKFITWYTNQFPLVNK